MTLSEAKKYLDGLQATKIELGLDRVRTAMELLGSPERGFRSVHVAGTNGKGSTCAFLESIFRNGLGLKKTALFTSPHLVDVRERMQINRELIGEDKFAKYISKVRDATDGKVHLTYFEFLTAVAFLWFAEENVDLAVVEVGLGGRFDSTNVLMPLVSVITRVAMDHQSYLGDTIEKIAFEKAGIIKAATPVVTIDQSKEVMQVIRDVCAQKDSMLHVANPIEVMWPLSLSGRHQRENAACALAAARIVAEQHVFKELTEEVLKISFASASWSGRLETVLDKPQVILDGAHNSNGALSLARTLQDDKSAKRRIFLLGIMADKDIDGILLKLLPLADRCVFAAPNGERSAAPARLLQRGAELFPEKKSEFEASDEDVFSALKKIVAEEPDAQIVVAGSLYMIGEIKEGMAENKLK